MQWHCRCIDLVDVSAVVAETTMLLTAAEFDLLLSLSGMLQLTRSFDNGLHTPLVDNANYMDNADMQLS